MSSEELTAAENRMSSLEAKLLALEGSAVSGGSNEAVENALKAYQLTMAQKLRAIRDAMIAENGSSESLSKVISERDGALAENAKLKKEIERLNYRVNHLVKALNAEEAKNASR
jgi:hypothetical protein